MDEVTRATAALLTLLRGDTTLATAIKAWSERTVPQTAKWVDTNGTTLLKYGVVRWATGQAIRRVRRTRIGMVLWFHLKVYQRTPTIADMQTALDRISALVDGQTLPWTGGQVLKMAVTQPLGGTDTVAGVDYAWQGYEVKLWATAST
jgi:hypothetical protein